MGGRDVVRASSRAAAAAAARVEGSLARDFASDYWRLAGSRLAMTEGRYFALLAYAPLRVGFFFVGFGGFGNRHGHVVVNLFDGRGV